MTAPDIHALHAIVENGGLGDDFGDVKELARLLGSNAEQGLPAGEDMAARQHRWGKNFVEPPRSQTLLELMWEACKDLTLIILLVSAITSLVLNLAVEKDFSKGWIDPLAIFLSATIVVLVSAVNDYQKEKQFRKLNAVKDDILINVVRGGQQVQVSVYEIVVGDVVELATGDLLAADGLFVAGHDLKVNESAMTGESDDIKKSEEVPILFSGTRVMEGSGRMLVLAVGEHSQQGIIRKLIADASHGGGAAAVPCDNDVSGGGGAAAAAAYGAVNSEAGDLERGTAEPLAARAAEPSFWQRVKGCCGCGGGGSGGGRGSGSGSGSGGGNGGGGGGVSFDLDDDDGDDSDDDGDGDVDGDGGEDAPLLAGSGSGGRRRKKEKAKKTKKQQETAVLQGKLEKLAVQIGKLGTFFAVITFVALVIRLLVRQFHDCHPTPPPFEVTCGWHAGLWSELLNFLTISITILVVAIPEGLPLAVTLSLAFSVRKQLEDNLLTRHLDACETMGSATTICSDKTGTLTMNRMTVMATWLAGEARGAAGVGADRPLPTAPELPAAVLDALDAGIALNSSARLEAPASAGGLVQHIGSKTECALLGFLDDQLGRSYQRSREEGATRIARVYTFSSARKRMSTLERRRAGGGGFRLHCKGASEIVIGLCTHALGAGGGAALPLDDELRASLLATVEAFATQGLRTLCLAFRDLDAEQAWEQAEAEAVECGLTLLGIFGIEDPVRPEVPRAIEKCRRAGITVRMVTGDNIATARSIARKCGILGRGGDDEVAMEGTEFRSRVLQADGVTLDQARFDELWPTLRVLARSSPTDKHTLVSGLIESQLHPAHPEVVAVTGDGTNDAPALKRADVGFAMGLAGTAVAKDASDIILMDDNFNSIVKAVMWGRNVYDSIAKFVQFQLTVNVVAIVVAFVGAVTTGESPLKTVQMLYINLIMDSLGALALTTDSPTDSLLDRKPYSRNQPLLSRMMLRNISLQSAYQLVVIFLILYKPTLFGVTDNGNHAEGKEVITQHYTFLYNTFVFLQVFNEINARKIHNEFNVFSGLHRNVVFIAIWVGTVGVQAILVNFGGQALTCTPIPWNLWLWSIGLGALSLLVQVFIHFVPANLIPVGPADEGGTGEYTGLVSEPLKGPEAIAARERWLRGTRRVALEQRTIRAFRDSRKEGLKRLARRVAFHRAKTTVEPRASAAHPAALHSVKSI